MLTGCLNAFRWLLWGVSVLLSLLLIVQKLRNDTDIRPGAEVAAIGAFMLAGLITGWVARRISAASALWIGQGEQMKNNGTPAAMAEVRREIDRLDDEIVALLAKRQRQIERAAAVKPSLGIPARVPARVEEVMARVADAAAREGLDQSLAQHLWHEMIEWSIALEEKLIRKSQERIEPQIVHVAGLPPLGG
eukprot:gene17470-17663_t